MKIQMIYRVIYNFVKKGDDKMTPAMRLGLTEKATSIKDIINFSSLVGVKP